MEKVAQNLSIDIHVLENCTVLITFHAEASRLAEETKYWREVLGWRGRVASVFVLIGEESGPPRVRPRKMFALRLWFSACYSQGVKAVYKL